MPSEREVIVYAVPWCEKCRAVRQILDAAGVVYRVADPEADPEAGRRLEGLTGGGVEVPAVEVGGRLLVDPAPGELGEALGFDPESLPPAYDVVILGGGPAGLTAAIYTAREGLRTLVLEAAMPGGQAALTDRIENYPGFPDPVNGAELMERVYRQALKFGAEVRTFEGAEGLEQAGTLVRVRTPRAEVLACGVIVATGSVYRRMGVPGEEELVGRGVSFCATCDAPFFKGKHVVVVGGGNSALQETVHLAQYADRITLVQNLDRLTASRVLQERVRALSQVEIRLGQRVRRVLGTDGVEGVEVEDAATGRVETVPCDGVFVFIGLQPNAKFLRGTVELDEGGFVKTDPATLATSMPGVFAAGDVRSGSRKQITSAAGEGTVAAFMVAEWIERRHRGGG